MASEAHLILGARRAKLRLAESSVRIVAIGALHQAFVDAVMHGHIELSLIFQMAAEAKLRLLFGKKEFGVLGVVDGMTVKAVHVVVSMLGTLKVHLLLAGGVTTQAGRNDFFRAGTFEDEDFRFVGGVIHVRGTRAVAGFAALLRRAAARVSAGGEVGRILPRAVFGVVAGLAGV